MAAGHLELQFTPLVLFPHVYEQVNREGPSVLGQIPAELKE